VIRAQNFPPIKKIYRMRRKSISGLFSGLKRNSVKDIESEETDSGKKTPKTPSSGKKK
jgi:hypothetical protein